MLKHVFYKSLASFFKVDSYVGHQRQAAVQKQTEMMQKSKAQVKRTHRSSDDSEEDSKPKLEVLQDIYNVKGVFDFISCAIRYISLSVSFVF